MQGILVFANAAARTSAITSPQEGQYSFLKDTNALEYYDGAAWVGAPVGDITAVTAGTGISGGGSSGAVTITNDMATTITASGDIVVGTGSGTYDNLPIGSTGQVLTADTTVSPYKVKWASASAGFKGCRLTFSSGVTVANGTNVTVNWDVETFDTDGFHSTVSNTSRITIPSGLGGKYLYCVKGLFENQAAGLSIIRLYKNGTQVLTVDMYKPSGAYTTTAFSDIIDLVATDYLEIVWYQNTGSSGTLQAGQSTSFGVQFLGA